MNNIRRIVICVKKIIGYLKANKMLIFSTLVYLRAEIATNILSHLVKDSG